MTLSVSACGDEPARPTSRTDARPEVADFVNLPDDLSHIESDALPPDCEHVVLSAPPFRLTECGGRLILSVSDRPAFELWPRATLAGATLRPGPGGLVTWRQLTETRADATFTSDDGSTTLHFGVARTGGVLGRTGGGLDLRIGLSVSGAVNTSEGDAVSLHLEPLTGSCLPGDELWPRSHRVLLTCPDFVAHFAAPVPAGGARVEASAIGLVATLPLDGGERIFPDVEVEMTGLRLDLGPDAVTAQVAWAASLGPVERTPTRILGWRSGPAFGPLLSPSILLDQSLAANGLFAGLIERPTTLLEGLWNTAPVSDEPVVGLLDDLASVGLAWFSRHEPDGRPPRSLDEPELRESVSRRAIELRERGVSALHFGDLGAAPARFFSELRRAVGPELLLFVELPLAFEGWGRIDGLSLPSALTRTARGGCPSAFDDSGSMRTPECEASLHRAVSADAQVETVETSTLAAALSRSWALSLTGLTLDPGGVVVGVPRTLADARRAAALAALFGGPYLAGDELLSLPSDRREILLAPLQRGAWRWPAARPLFASGVADAPVVFSRSGHTLAAFDFSGTGADFESPASLDPAFAETGPLIEVFTGRIFPADSRIEVPAGDVVLLVRPPL